MSHHWHEDVGVRWCPCDEGQEAPGVPTAAAPDPRFRDQLAEAPCRNCFSASESDGGHVYGERKCCPECDHRTVREWLSAALRHLPADLDRELVDLLAPLMATEIAHVEARVQAAADQRAAEELEAAADEKVIVSVDHFREILRARAAALASPAPAPRAEEGQR